MRISDSGSAYLPAVIQGIGWVILLGHVGSYFYFADGGLSAVLTFRFVLSLLSVAPFAGTIIVGGYWLGTTDITSSRYQRVGAWFIGGLASFLLLNLAIIVTWSEAPLSWNIAWGLYAAGVGGAGGIIAGTFEARAISRAVEAERHRLQREAVEQRNERLDEFAAVVAHDLRNPLNVASGSLELARVDRDSDHLERVASSLDRMETLVERTLTLARSGHDISEPEPVALATLVDSCWAAVPTAGAGLENEADIVIDADPDRLRHLFENLFRNSVEHGSTSSQPESDDSADRDDGGLRIRVGATADGFYVADNGPGIPPSKRDAVLEEGYSTADGEGGLGLAIVQRIVEAHGWAIAVTDSWADGTRFEVTGVTVSDDADSNGDGYSRSKTPIEP